MPDQLATSIGPRLDRLPLGRFHYRLIFLIGAGLFLDTLDINIGGSVLGAVLHDGWSTLQLNASFMFFTFAGMMIGSIFGGIVGDRLGRRFCYQFNLLLFGAASLAAAVAPNMPALIACRFVIGIGLGAEAVLGYAMLLEFLPAANRRRCMVFLNLVTNVTGFGASALAYVVIPPFGWRAMFAIVGVASIAVWYMRKQMPESPRWLEAKNRTAEADAIVRAAEEEVRSLQELPPPAASAPVVEHNPSIWVLFSPALIRRTVLGMTFNVAFGIGLYGFLHWLPTIFVKDGMSLQGSLGVTLIFSLGGPVGIVLTLVAAGFFNPRSMIIFASVAVAIGSIGLLQFSTGTAFLIAGGVVVCALYASTALTFALRLPELFPTECRVRGTGVCATVGRLTTAFVQYGVVFVYDHFALTGMIVAVIVTYLLQALLTFWLDRTPDSRELEQLAPGSLLEHRSHA